MNKHELNEMRLRLWTMAAIEAEMELAELDTENKFLKLDDPGHEDVEWNNKQIVKLQHKLLHANKRIKELEGLVVRE